MKFVRDVGHADGHTEYEPELHIMLLRRSEPRSEPRLRFCRAHGNLAGDSGGRRIFVLGLVDQHEGGDGARSVVDGNELCLLLLPQLVHLAFIFVDATSIKGMASLYEVHSRNDDVFAVEKKVSQDTSAGGYWLVQ